MPILRGAVTVRGGAVVRVRIGLTRGEVAKLHVAKLPVPSPVDVMALLDSGAECTCADPAVLARLPLALSSYGLLNAPGVSGVGFNYGYDASLTVLHPSNDPKQHLLIPNFTIAELPLNLLGYQAIIGRDVLTRCLFTYDGPGGTFTLAY